MAFLKARDIIVGKDKLNIDELKYLRNTSYEKNWYPQGITGGCSFMDSLSK